ncbi:cyclin-D3-1-like [Impatiens glandulifera]|uniref:cyclin-D3-1-like n=1 Tax=Impatiens glandulifera TaxID=253017 RepID=UPI001FB17F25|nr:cyclin-D3-1-like [Impatiens glandulifera]
MAIQHPQNHPLLQFDALYCEEEEQGQQWEDEEEEEDDNGVVVELGPERSCVVGGGTNNVPFLLPLLLLSEQDLLWEDEELVSLFSKEQEQIHPNPDMDPALILVRKEAVEWMFKVVAFYGFTTLTSILAINYLDRFLSTVHFQRDKPWMVQLSAVTCLSIAAKVEETQVPLLLDLQVEDTKYMFEAKTIQRMELVVLSALKWRMNLVTPLSFMDHIVMRLGLKKKTHLQWEFLRRSERLIVSVVADWRSVCFLPSVLATATMLHIIIQQQEVDPLNNNNNNDNAIDYQTQLLRLLNITNQEEQEKVKDCYQLIMDILSSSKKKMMNGVVNKKRKYDEEENPESPNGVIDLSFSCDCNELEEEEEECWVMVGGPPSVCSSPEVAPAPMLKKMRTEMSPF